MQIDISFILKLLLLVFALFIIVDVQLNSLLKRRINNESFYRKPKIQYYAANITRKMPAVF